MTETPPFTLRLARPDDLDTLTGLLQDLFAIEADFDVDPARQRRGLELMLEDRTRALVLVAEAGGAVVGMCTVQLLISTAEGGLAGLVEDVVVAPEWRGRGVGRALLAALGDQCRLRGVGRLQLVADRDNDGALAFYERTGWHTTRLTVLRRRIDEAD